MNGYDIDGVLTAGHTPQPGEEWCVISGRTWAEYDTFVRSLAVQAPVYIRGAGAYGDQQAAGDFKAIMCLHLGIERFFEDDPIQAKIITEKAPYTEVVLVSE